MKHLIFGIAGFNIAETTRMLEIAKYLSNQFKITFISYGGSYEFLVKEYDFPLIKMSPRETEEKIEHIMKIDRMEKIAEPFSEQEIDQRVQNELALFQKLNPVAVFFGSCITLSISTKIAKIPLINVFPFALTTPYIQNGLPIMPNAPRFLNRVIGKLFLNMPILMRSFNRVATKYHLPKFKSVMYLWQGDINYITELPILYSSVRLPENWTFVGPIFANLKREIPKEVFEFIGDQALPTVYFAMGSSANIRILKRVLNYFEGLPVKVIAPIKQHLAKTTVQIPANVLVTDWLPAPKVNALVDFGVIHGGQGTVQTANVSGMPFIGIGMQPEQSLNIYQSVKYGVAIQIPRRSLSRKKFRQSINEMIDNKSYQIQAKKLQKHAETQDGAWRIAQSVKEQFL